MTHSPIPLQDHLCFALYGAHLAMGGVYKPLLDPLGLTYPQYIVLLSLWETDGQTVGQIGARLGLGSNTLTPLLKRMEALSLLSRNRNREDERQVLLFLTPAGKAMQARTAHVPGCILQASGLDLAALADLQTRIMGLRDSLDQTAAN